MFLFFLVGARTENQRYVSASVNHKSPLRFVDDYTVFIKSAQGVLKLLGNSLLGVVLRHFRFFRVLQKY